MVPNGWSKTYLKNIISGTIKNGYSPLPAANITGYWVMSLGALTDNGINPTEIKPVELDDKVRKALLTNGDFLISRSNTPDKVGRSIRFKGEIENCSYPDLMMKFRVDPEKADPNFLEFKLSSSEIRQYYKSCAAGSSRTMVKINKSVVENTPLLLPSFLEQKKIAQILSTWEKAITTTEQLLASSQQQKKALMQQLLTGKKRLLDKNGVRFSGEWERNHLKKLLQISKGNQLNKDTLSKSGEYAVINGGIEPSGYTGEYNTEANTITISEGGNSCGFVGLQSTKFWCGGHCYAIKNLKIDLNFTYQLLKFNQSKIMRLRVGSGLPNIQKKDLEALSVDYPISQEEQQKIAAVLSSADQEISTLQQKLDALKQEKKALMQQLLTGKSRVKIN
ncbi:MULTISPECIES: restriction endonuclease subunit S [Vibrio]|uniref:restriction endonuclease subunit S n=1 Tax=Vibrio TaxID=662 RepID=UPI001BD39482|nr:MULTISPECIES: restriction endonuclease subunit S [Vibrio]MBT0091874.1 restriction endonuclease subunit S [Vibrio alginolyticus]MCA6721443.1 restriction endonuclease subunit S [Vibrio alginolyticus]MDW1731553.1 restriction endonuclease subunit S [Vibrio sp. Vb2356]MDW2260063.1 restriction endonuclease subunit S [Vibrio sp. 1409]